MIKNSFYNIKCGNNLFKIMIDMTVPIERVSTLLRAILVVEIINLKLRKQGIILTRIIHEKIIH